MALKPKVKKAGYIRMEYDKFMDAYANQDFEFKYHLMGKLAFGNAKLPKDTVIFNMGSGTDCPSKRLGMCEVINAGVKCYAINAEIQYKDVLSYRRRSEVYWKSVTAEEFCDDLIKLTTGKYFFDKEKLKGQRKTYYVIKQLRLNESGDLDTQEDFTKAVKVANILWEQYGMRTYMYTARKDLNLKNFGHLNVNGSGFMVTNNYRAVPAVPFPLKADERECKCDCKRCNLCAVAKGKTIYVPYH